MAQSRPGVTAWQFGSQLGDDEGDEQAPEELLVAVGGGLCDASSLLQGAAVDNAAGADRVCLDEPAQQLWIMSRRQFGDVARQELLEIAAQPRSAFGGGEAQDRFGESALDNELDVVA